MTNKEKLQELENRIEKIERTLRINGFSVELRDGYDLNEVGGLVRYRDQR
jgi:hypothetical protein